LLVEFEAGAIVYALRRFPIPQNSLYGEVEDR
jgi:hypothetical protein